MLFRKLIALAVLAVIIIVYSLVYLSSSVTFSDNSENSNIFYSASDNSDNSNIFGVKPQKFIETL